MKTKTLLIAAVMFFGLTAAAFAQATFSVGSIPVTAVINTGQVEQTGDITFTQTSGLTNLGTITVSYGVQITNDTTGALGIRITTGAGFVGAAPTINAVNNSGGQVVVSVPANGTVNNTFTLTGVRVAVAGTTLTSLSASISTTNNAITAGQTNVIVISSIAPGIASIETDTAAKINATTGTANPSAAVLTVKEGFLNAWGDTTNATNAGIRITLSAAPPKGVILKFAATASTDGITPPSPVWQTMKADGTILNAEQDIASDSDSLAVYYRAATTTDPTKQETLTINVTVDTSGVESADLPFTAGSITYVVSLAPIGTAFDSDGHVITDPKLIPRYAASDVGPDTLLTIVGTTTTLLVPFAQTVTSAEFNTGFAIANTTEDPGQPTGKESPVAQSGTITFYFFPQTSGGTAPATFSYTTDASSPGTGLDANGRLPAGSTYTVLLSQILAAKSAPSEFSGYIFIVTNFTNAHCLYVVSNFSTFSQGSLALVITSDRNGASESLNN